jgi:hypothetical protein
VGLERPSPGENIDYYRNPTYFDKRDAVIRFLYSESIAGVTHPATRSIYNASLHGNNVIFAHQMWKDLLRGELIPDADAAIRGIQKDWSKQWMALYNHVRAYAFAVGTESPENPTPLMGRPFFSPFSSMAPSHTSRRVTHVPVFFTVVDHNQPGLPASNAVAFLQIDPTINEAAWSFVMRDPFMFKSESFAYAVVRKKMEYTTAGTKMRVTGPTLLEGAKVVRGAKMRSAEFSKAIAATHIPDWTKKWMKFDMIGQMGRETPEFALFWDAFKYCKYAILVAGASVGGVDGQFEWFHYSRSGAPKTGTERVAHPIFTGGDETKNVVLTIDWTKREVFFGGATKPTPLGFAMLVPDAMWERKNQASIVPPFPPIPKVDQGHLWRVWKQKHSTRATLHKPADIFERSLKFFDPTGDDKYRLMRALYKTDIRGKTTMNGGEADVVYFAFAAFPLDDVRTSTVSVLFQDQLPVFPLDSKDRFEKVEAENQLSFIDGLGERDRIGGYRGAWRSQFNQIIRSLFVYKQIVGIRSMEEVRVVGSGSSVLSRMDVVASDDGHSYVPAFFTVAEGEERVETVPGTFVTRPAKPRSVAVLMRISEKRILRPPSVGAAARSVSFRIARNALRYSTSAKDKGKKKPKRVSTVDGPPVLVATDRRAGATVMEDYITGVFVPNWTVGLNVFTEKDIATPAGNKFFWDALREGSSSIVAARNPMKPGSYSWFVISSPFFKRKDVENVTSNLPTGETGKQQPERYVVDWKGQQIWYAVLAGGHVAKKEKFEIGIALVMRKGALQEEEISVAQLPEPELEREAAAVAVPPRAPAVVDKYTSMPDVTGAEPLVTPAQIKASRISVPSHLREAVERGESVRAQDLGLIGSPNLKMYANITAAWVKPGADLKRYNTQSQVPLPVITLKPPDLAVALPPASDDYDKMEAAPVYPDEGGEEEGAEGETAPRPSPRKKKGKGKIAIEKEESDDDDEEEEELF